MQPTLKLVVLGTIQDAGAPHIGCKKDCCKDLFEHPNPNLKVVSLGVIDSENKVKLLFEATPDITSQMRTLKSHCDFETNDTPDTIILTHAHIGHYTGLMYLGKEALSTKKLPVYAMSRMKSFLQKNGPWNQLVKDENIEIKDLSHEKEEKITSQLSILPILVPHRDEYSETVGFVISGKTKKALFIPDIDKWQKWDRNIVTEIEQVDYAFIDATFYDAVEINNRDIAAIPHSFVIESMELFKDLPKNEKNKIYFTHLNHTNPLINIENRQSQFVLEQGFHIAQFNTVFEL